MKKKKEQRTENQTKLITLAAAAADAKAFFIAFLFATTFYVTR